MKLENKNVQEVVDMIVEWASHRPADLYSQEVLDLPSFQAYLRGRYLLASHPMNDMCDPAYALLLGILCGEDTLPGYKSFQVMEALLKTVLALDGSQCPQPICLRDLTILTKFMEMMNRLTPEDHAEIMEDVEIQLAGLAELLKEIHQVAVFFYVEREVARMPLEESTKVEEDKREVTKEYLPLDRLYHLVHTDL